MVLRILLILLLSTTVYAQTSSTLIRDNNGNIGIASITPGTALDVQGTIRASTDIKIGTQSVCQANGTNCIAESDPQVDTVTNNNFCKGTGTTVSCTDSNTYLTAESDPQVGTLTNTKWCTTDGSAVNCTSDAPAGSSQWVTISSVGIGTTDNVGFGTYYPSAEVHISSNDANNLVLIEDAGLDDVSPFIISSTGNVGIGTTLTSASLSIKQTSTFSILDIKNSSNTSVVNINSSGHLRYGHTSGGSATSSTWFTFGNTFLETQGDNPFFLINPGTGNTGRLLEVRKNTTPYFTIDNLGNVGISTNVPESRFDIVSTDSYNAFRVNDNTSDTTPFIINSEGNVGIGTQISPNKLYVAGTAEMQGFKLPGNGAAASYVLTSNTVGVGTWMPIPAGAGSGDITDVFSCASGDCASVTVADGDLLNFSGANNSTTTEGIILPQGTAPTGGTAEGQIGWDTDNDFALIGDGTGVKRFVDVTQLYPADASSTKCTANITADAATALSVTGCSYYSLDSDNATSTNRTFCLAAGTEGQVLTLFADVTTTDEIELGDGAAGACAGGTGAATFLAGVWPAATNQNNDVATVVYRTTASGAVANGWYEVSRAAN